MAYTQRRQEILTLLKESDSALSTDQLCALVYASRSTMRRDLIRMEEEGLVIRHFGAVSLTPSSSKESAAARRVLENRDKKSAIARLAATLLHDNMVLFLDSSSTVSYLVPYITAHENMTVITNGIDVALKLNTARSVTCFLCPGVVKHNSYSTIGEYASSFLSGFSADAAFLSCKAVRPSGLYEGDSSQAMIKRHMIRGAVKTAVLCDSSKENCQGFIRLSDFSDIAALITDARPSAPLSDAVKAAGCALLSCSSSRPPHS